MRHGEPNSPPPPPHLFGDVILPHKQACLKRDRQEKEACYGLVRNLQLPPPSPVVLQHVPVSARLDAAEDVGCGGVSQDVVDNLCGGGRCGMGRWGSMWGSGGRWGVGGVVWCGVVWCGCGAVWSEAAQRGL